VWFVEHVTRRRTTIGVGQDPVSSSSTASMRVLSMGIEAFSHVEILFLFDRVEPESVVSGARHPRNNQVWPAIGIFAQRGKKRPNRIGSTICQVIGREGPRLEVAEFDAIEGSPVLDIKPVMQEFLPRTEVSQPDWSRELMRAYWLPERVSAKR
jgi:tRNA (Thr-GGU) A37 N-methylase